MITASFIFWLIQLVSPTVINSPAIKPNCSTLPIDPVEGIIFKSEDNGQTWSNVDYGLPAEVNAFAFLAGESTCYLGAADGLYKKNEPLPKQGCMQGWYKDAADLKGILGIYPGRDGIYMISQREGLLQHLTATGAWQPMDTNLKDKTIHTLIETQDGILLVGSESGIYRTTNKGNTWKQVFQGQVTKLSFDKGVMLCASHLGLWRSTDSGENWNRVFTSASHPFIVQPLGKEWVTIVQSQDFLGMRTANIVYTSTDEGLTWNPAKESFPSELNTIYDIRESGNYRIACSDSGIYRSADKGKTWTQVLPKPQQGNFFRLYSSGQNLFALYIDGC